MTASRPQPASGDLGDGFLAWNVGSLQLGGNTLDQVAEATPEGDLVTLPDGDQAIRYRGAVIGAPPDDASRRQTFADIRSNPRCVVVIFGVGTGTTVREVRSRTDCPIVVMEPNPGILRMVLDKGPTDLGGVQIVTDLMDLRGCWPGLARGRSLATLISTPGYDALFPEQSSKLSEAISRLVEKVQINENTYRARSKAWVDHVLANVEALPGSIPALALADRFSGVPAFILGAGPSLNHNGQLLREVMRKGIAFAAEVSGQICVHYNAEPQFLVSIESIDLSKQVLALPWIDRVLRAYSMLAHPNVIAAGKGPWLPFHEDMAEFSSLTDLLGVPPVTVGGSVTTAAFSLACRLGCSPIVMLGQDLAYPGGETYARGCGWSESKARVSQDGRRLVYEWSEMSRKSHGTSAGALPTTGVLHEVDAWGGKGTVPSSEAFSSFRSWFEQMADACHRKTPDVRLINASEGGSSIRGFEELVLDEVLQGLPNLDMTSESIAADARQRRTPLTREDVRRWAECQAELIRGIGIAAGRLHRVAQMAGGLLDANVSQEINRAFRVLSRGEARLARACVRQRMPEAWACTVLQRVTSAQRDMSNCTDAEMSARASLEAELSMTEVVKRAASDLENRFHELADRCGEEATPNTEKVRCLC